MATLFVKYSFLICQTVKYKIQCKHSFSDQSMESPTTSNVSQDLKIERKKHRLEAIKRYSKTMYEKKKKVILYKKKGALQKK